MLYRDGKIIIPKGDLEEVFELTSEEKLKIKLGGIYYFDYEKREVVIEIPENFEERKTSYIEDNIADIKGKYKNIIFSKYSLTDQLNMTQEAQLITSIAQYENRELRENEVQKLNKLKEARLWIEEKREECSSEIDDFKTKIGTE